MMENTLPTTIILRDFNNEMRNSWQEVPHIGAHLPSSLEDESVLMGLIRIDEENEIHKGFNIRRTVVDVGSFKE